MGSLVGGGACGCSADGVWGGSGTGAGCGFGSGVGAAGSRGTSLSGAITGREGSSGVGGSGTESETVGVLETEWPGVGPSGCELCEERGGAAVQAVQVSAMAAVHSKVIRREEGIGKTSGSFVHSTEQGKQKTKQG